ncbi:hypothetical protein ACIBF5_09605 [Micromonospora sp. NPDC050417]|uniref:hypothetical protein n=1 Tax=Micromonospora sp. NPDC050417 TaxID=3364280 RepID=UPI0037AB3028
MAQHRTARERAAYAAAHAAVERAWNRALAGASQAPVAPVPAPAEQADDEPRPISPAAWRRRCREIRIEIEDARAASLARARMRENR